MRAQPKRVIEKKNPLEENVFLTIGIEWAYLRQNRRDDRNRFWTFSRGITHYQKKGYVKYQVTLILSIYNC